MKHILTFLFLTLCLFSQVHASTEVNELSCLKEYLIQRKAHVDQKIIFYADHHRHLYRSEERYWLYQGKAEAYDEIIMYLQIYEIPSWINDPNRKW